MSDLNEVQNPTFYRVRIKDGHNAVGLVVSAAGKRCIPSTQFWLTVDACAAYRFPHSAALHVQVRLGNMGFTTVLEEIQDPSAKDWLACRVFALDPRSGDKDAAIVQCGFSFMACFVAHWPNGGNGTVRLGTPAGEPIWSSTTRSRIGGPEADPAQM